MTSRFGGSASVCSGVCTRSSIHGNLVALITWATQKYADVDHNIIDFLSTSLCAHGLDRSMIDPRGEYERLRRIPPRVCCKHRRFSADMTSACNHSMLTQSQRTSTRGRGACLIHLQSLSCYSDGCHSDLALQSTAATAVLWKQQ